MLHHPPGRAPRWVSALVGCLDCSTGVGGDFAALYGTRLCESTDRGTQLGVIRDLGPRELWL